LRGLGLIVRVRVVALRIGGHPAVLLQAVGAPFVRVQGLVLVVFVVRGKNLGVVGLAVPFVSRLFFIIQLSVASKGSPCVHIRADGATTSRNEEMLASQTQTI
jgi:hypothetical protein